jgi:LEA14-like dessication related protein
VAIESTLGMTTSKPEKSLKLCPNSLSITVWAILINLLNLSCAGTMPFCPNCGKAASEGAAFCPSCGYRLAASLRAQPQPVPAVPKSTAKVSHKGRNIGIAVIVLILVLVGGSFALQTAQRVAIQNVTVVSVTPSNIGVHLSGVTMDVDMVVHNPNSITATLDQVSYSVYANNDFLGSGQTTTTYNIPPQSDYKLTFPLTMGWGSAFSAVGSYILNGGHVTWELKGTDSVNINGLSYSVPFDFTTG